MSPFYRPQLCKIYIITYSWHLTFNTKLKIILFNWRIYIIVLFKKNTHKKYPYCWWHSQAFPVPPVSIPWGEDLGRWYSPIGELGGGVQAVPKPRKEVYLARAGHGSFPLLCPGSSPTLTLMSHLSQLSKAVQWRPQTWSRSKGEGQMTPVRGMPKVFRISNFN